MVDNTESAFWVSIPENVRIAVEQTVPAKVLEERISNSTTPETLEGRYTLVEHLLKDIVNQEDQNKQFSDQHRSSGQSTNNLQASALFPLAMVQTELKQYAAAEETYRQLLATNLASRPDLAATSNLIDVLNLQRKYAEAQSMAINVLPLLQKELGANSPQYLGCMRKLMESLVGQNKGEEARHLYRRGLSLVATMNDGEGKKEEDDAMQEMGKKIDVLK